MFSYSQLQLLCNFYKYTNIVKVFAVAAQQHAVFVD